jgi:hypothetical protein
VEVGSNTSIVALRVVGGDGRQKKEVSNLRHTVTSLVAVAQKRLSTADVPLPLGSQTLLGFNYQLLTAATPND